MTERLSPAAARRVFLVLTVTRWFPVGLVVGITTLWPLERGLTVPQTLSATSLVGLTVLPARAPNEWVRRRLRSPTGLPRLVRRLCRVGHRVLHRDGVVAVRRRRRAHRRLPGPRLRPARGVVRRHRPGERARLPGRRRPGARRHRSRLSEGGRGSRLRRARVVAPSVHAERAAAAGPALPGLERRAPHRRGPDSARADHPRRTVRSSAGPRVGA